MDQKLSPEEIERLANKRANAKLVWYIHATVYVLVNMLIFAQSAYGWGRGRWSPEPLFGWGIGLALHGVAVFVIGGGSSFRERMVQKERDRLLRQHDKLP